VLYIINFITVIVTRLSTRNLQSLVLVKELSSNPAILLLVYCIVIKLYSTEFSRLDRASLRLSMSAILIVYSIYKGVEIFSLAKVFLGLLLDNYGSSNLLIYCVLLVFYLLLSILLLSKVGISLFSNILLAL
jgi:hypothetical protein